MRATGLRRVLVLATEGGRLYRLFPSDDETLEDVLGALDVLLLLKPWGVDHSTVEPRAWGWTEDIEAHAWAERVGYRWSPQEPPALKLP